MDQYESRACFLQTGSYPGKQPHSHLNTDSVMPDTKGLEGNLDYKTSDPEVTYSFAEDKISIVNPLHLSDTSTFQQLFLIGKILGESLPI